MNLNDLKHLMPPRSKRVLLCLVSCCSVAGTTAFCAEGDASASDPCPGAHQVKVPLGLDGAQQNSYSVPVWQQAGQRDRVVGLASGKELVDVVLCRGDWCQVRWRGKGGWLPKDSLEGKSPDGCRTKPASAETMSKPAPIKPKPLPATPWAVWERRLVRVNAAGEVACLAHDGRNCDYDKPLDDPLLKQAHPPALTCGADYQKKYGYTGYDSPGHWCWRYRNELEGVSNLQLIGAATGSPVQLANADGQALATINFRAGWAVDQINWNGVSVGGNGGGPHTASLVNVDSITVVHGKYQHSGSPISIGSLIIRYLDGTEDKVGGAQGFSNVRQDVVHINGTPIVRLIAWSDGYLVTGLQFALQGRKWSYDHPPRYMYGDMNMSNKNSVFIPVGGLAALWIALALTGCATSATYHKISKSSQSREQAPIKMGSDTISALGSINQQKLAQSVDPQSPIDLSKAVVLYGGRYTYVIASGADQMLSILRQFPSNFFLIKPDVFHLGKPSDTAGEVQPLRGNLTLIVAATDAAATPLTDTQMSLLRQVSFKGSEQSGYSRVFSVQGMALPARSVPAAGQTAQQWSRQLTLDLVQDQDPLPPTPRRAAVAKMAGALLFDAVTSPLQILYYTLKH